MLRLLIGPYLAMPMHWKWAAWFTSFAVLLALWTRSFGAAVAVWVLLLFVIAGLRRVRSGSEALATEPRRAQRTSLRRFGGLQRAADCLLGG
jgi:hypothetical protein